MAHYAAHGASADTAERLSTFHSLKFPDYRNLWLGQVGASASMWMEQIARPLLILELTDSGLMLGLLAATRMLPQLLIGIWAGVLADRMDKKKLLGASQFVTFAMHLLTALLLLGGVIEVWMVFLTTFISGSSMAFNQPARQSLIAQLVPPSSLHNAVALNSAAVNFMRIGGAGFAGFLVAFLDFGEIYLIQALIYVGVIYTTIRITAKHDAKPRKNRGSMREEMVQGFAVAKRDKIIFYILVLTLVIFLFGMPYQSVFVPLLAEDKLGLNKSGVGFMIAFVGMGALVGSLSVATIGNTIRNRGYIMIGLLCVYSFALFALANAPTIYLAIPALVISGAMQTSFMSINNAFVLGRTDSEYHGRIMSLFSLDRGLLPMGAALGGLLSEIIGPSAGLMLMASCCLIVTLIIAVFVPSIRRIE
ncbi:MAG: MFS transporter [Dehalococcoidia bacterium]